MRYFGNCLLLTVFFKVDLQCLRMAAVVQAAAGKEYTTAGPRNVQLGLEDIKGCI